MVGYEGFLLYIILKVKSGLEKGMLGNSDTLFNVILFCSQEWVPIITRDSQRQRRQSSQGPFSDAYLSGMPSKRRKLITSAKPQGNLAQVITGTFFLNSHGFK